MSGYLLQCGTFDTARLLKVSAPFHHGYAHAHGLMYRADFAHRSPSSYSPVWDKIAYLRVELGFIPDGEFVCNLGADTWIEKRGVSVKSALPDGYDLAILKGDGFLNSEVMMMQNSQALRDYLDACWQEVPKRQIDNQDAIMFDLLPQSGLKVYALSDHWNYFDTWQGDPRPVCCKKEDAYILHWASIPRAEVLKDFERLAS